MAETKANTDLGLELVDETATSYQDEVISELEDSKETLGQVEALPSSDFWVEVNPSNSFDLNRSCIRFHGS